MPLGGTFRVKFRGVTGTHNVSVNTTGPALEAALEELASVDDVRVELDAVEGEDPIFGSRSGVTRAWLVTFVTVRKKTEFGWEVEDPHGNLAPVTLLSALTGTGAEAVVTADFVQRNNPPGAVGGQRSGAIQANAGAVYVFRRRDPLAANDTRGAPNEGSAWPQTQRLQPSDLDASDLFGESVALRGPALVVGAPGAHGRSVEDVQPITCVAASGQFVLSFGNRSTRAVDARESSEALQTALRAVTEQDVVVAPAVSRVCNATSSDTLRIFYPKPLASDARGFEVNSTVLLDDSGGAGSLTLGPVTKSSAGGRAADAAPVQGGAVYFFAFNASAGDGSGATGRWEPQLRFLPVEVSSGQRFGAAVHLVTPTEAVVGSPGSAGSEGTLHILRRDSNASAAWREVAVIVPTERGEGAAMGTAIDSDGDATVVVGAPGTGKSPFQRGHVYSYLLLTAGQRPYGLQQVLTAPGGEEDQFGASLSISGNLLVVGAPGHAPTPSRPRTGAIYVYQRASALAKWELHAVKLASNGQPHDAFGRGVASLLGSLVVACAHRDYAGPLGPRSTVHVIRTLAPRGTDVAGHFVLMQTRVPQAVAPMWERPLCYVGTSVLCPRHRADFHCRPCLLSMDRYQFVGSDRIPANASAATLEGIVEELVGVDVTVRTRRLPVVACLPPLTRHFPSLAQVSRKGPDAQAGYEWRVTYVGLTDSVMDPLTAYSELLGEGADVRVSVASIPATFKARSGAYVFELDGETSHWTEQAVLTVRARLRRTAAHGLDTCTHAAAVLPICGPVLLERGVGGRAGGHRRAQSGLVRAWGQLRGCLRPGPECAQPRSRPHPAPTSD